MSQVKTTKTKAKPKKNLVKTKKVAKAKKTSRKNQNVSYLDDLPVPALQQVLLNMERQELNRVCNLSARAKKVCDEHNFREMYLARHQVFTDKQVVENAPTWIRDYIGETDFDEVENIRLTDIVDILDMIEAKTASNKTRIIFYGEEVFNSKFVKQVAKLKAGFVAKSMFVGIVGSFVAECILEPKRLRYHIDIYDDIARDDFLQNNGPPLSVGGFLVHVYGMYDGFSSIFDLNETFKSETYKRIADERGLSYKNKEVIAKLADVDVWDVNRLRETLKNPDKKEINVAKAKKAPAKFIDKKAPVAAPISKTKNQDEATILSLMKKSKAAKAKKAKAVPKAKKAPGKTVYVVVYVYLDDANEPQVNVFGTKKAAIAYVQKEIRDMDGHDDFTIDPNDEELRFEREGSVHEIFTRKIQ